MLINLLHTNIRISVIRSPNLVGYMRKCQPVPCNSLDKNSAGHRQAVQHLIITVKLKLICLEYLFVEHPLSHSSCFQ